MSEKLMWIYATAVDELRRLQTLPAARRGVMYPVDLARAELEVDELTRLHLLPARPPATGTNGEGTS